MANCYPWDKISLKCKFPFEVLYVSLLAGDYAALIISERITENQRPIFFIYRPCFHFSKALLAFTFERTINLAAAAAKKETKNNHKKTS